MPGVTSYSMYTSARMTVQRLGVELCHGIKRSMLSLTTVITNGSLLKRLAWRCRSWQRPQKFGGVCIGTK